MQHQKTYRGVNEAHIDKASVGTQEGSAEETHSRNLEGVQVFKAKVEGVNRLPATRVDFKTAPRVGMSLSGRAPA